MISTTEIPLEDKIRYTKAKVRNIIYYRLEVEPTIEERFRCQYIRVIRGLRRQIEEFYGSLPEGKNKTFFSGILNIIDPKIKSNECLSTIIEMKEYLDTYEGQ